MQMGKLIAAGKLVKQAIMQFSKEGWRKIKNDKWLREELGITKEESNIQWIFYWHPKTKQTMARKRVLDVDSLCWQEYLYEIRR